MDTQRNYTFLPWMRQGLAAEITLPDRLGEAGTGVAPQRAEVPVAFKVNGQAVGKPVQVLGPGDIIGINPRVVVKTDPRHWVTDFEPNYLAFIEFYEEDCPWRFTPATARNGLADSRLRPWMGLVVLAEGEFDERQTGGPLAAFELRTAVDSASVFPDPTQSWAWAHVHVSQNIIGNGLRTATPEAARAAEQNLQSTLAANPDLAASRLLCPRKLQPNTAYHAFVVPAFETGRRAGLGLDVPAELDGQLASWGAGQRLYPIYYRWFFRTGERGDFEFLVDLIEPRPVDKRVGVRDMDMQRPGFEVSGLAPPLDVLGLEGALKSPQTESFPAQWPPEGAVFADPPPGSAGQFLSELEARVNLQFQLQEPETEANPHPDPLISLPLYGQWHAPAGRLGVQHPTGWVDELNGDPRTRVLAGAGTTVIQQHQERLMQQAWSQLGDLLQANQKIRQFQLGWMTAFRVYQKHLLPQPPDDLLVFTRPVQARLKASPVTIAQLVRESRLPPAALDPAFRKLTRQRGALMRRVTADVDARRRPLISELNAGRLTAAPPAPHPTGQLSLNQAAQAVAPRNVPGWLQALVEHQAYRPIMLGLMALSVLLALVTCGLSAVAGAWLWLAAERLRRQLAAATPFREANLTPAAVDAIPPRPGFALTEFGAAMPASDDASGRDSVEAANLRAALKDAFDLYQRPPAPKPDRAPLAVSPVVARLQQALNPAVAIPRRAAAVLKLPPRIKDGYLRPRKTLVPIMAHPVFTEPMVRPLIELSSEFLAPNLDLIPNNTISLMLTNPRYIEAYMVGLNHEMARELLWREFPTDQRGSYFRQFWDVGETLNRDPSRPPAEVEAALLDITALHTWGRETPLGSHANRPLPAGGQGDEARLVLVIRGDLLKKYPTAVIYAQRAKWDLDEHGRDIRVLDDGDPAQAVQAPLFKAEIEPDIRFLGFDLMETQAKGNPERAANDPGWFFIIQERPGEPRFGLDNRSDDTPDAPTRWDQLAWEHLPNFASLGCIDLHVGDPGAAVNAEPDGLFRWGRNAADMAYILYQVPVMVAYHAADMLA